MTPREAVALQEKLRSRVVRSGSVRPRLVAGVDVSERGDRARAAIVVTRDLEPVEEVAVEQSVPFPYVPGLLSFRELPPLRAAWKKLRARPDVIIADGQGYAHPRRFGLACHLGVELNIPTIGCAKSRLLGEHDEPGNERGSQAPLVDGGERIGTVLRTRTGVKPVWISVGHRISLAEAVRVILACSPRYRLPDPQRFADRLSKAWKKPLAPRRDS